MAKRKSLDLEGERVEAVMYVVSLWAQLARREMDAGRLGEKEARRLVIVEQVVMDWRTIKGGGLASR